MAGTDVKTFCFWVPEQRATILLGAPVGSRASKTLESGVIIQPADGSKTSSTGVMFYAQGTPQQLPRFLQEMLPSSAFEGRKLAPTRKDWVYKNGTGQTFGPFSAAQIAKWNDDNHFEEGFPVKHEPSQVWLPAWLLSLQNQSSAKGAGRQKTLLQTSTITGDVDMADADEIAEQLKQLRSSTTYQQELSEAMDMDIDEISAYLGPLEAAQALAIAPRPAVIANRRHALVYIVLDTNVLLTPGADTVLLDLRKYYGPKAQESGEQSVRIILYVPYIVLVELDRIKMQNTALAPKAQQANGMLKKAFEDKDPAYEAQSMSEMKDAFEKYCYGLPASVISADDRILQACKHLKDVTQGEHVVALFSNDKNLCLKAMVNKFPAISTPNLVDKGLSGLKRVVQTILLGGGDGRTAAEADTGARAAQTARASAVAWALKGMPEGMALETMDMHCGGAGEYGTCGTPMDVQGLEGSLDLASGMHRSGSDGTNSRPGVGLAGSVQSTKGEASKPVSGLQSAAGGPAAGNSAVGNPGSQKVPLEAVMEQYKLLEDTLPSVVEARLREEFGEEIWQFVVSEPPPWDSLQLLFVLTKHWRSVFSSFGSKNESAVKWLLEVLKNINRGQHKKGVSRDMFVDISKKVQKLLSLFQNGSANRTSNGNNNGATGPVAAQQPSAGLSKAAKPEANSGSGRRQAPPPSSPGAARAPISLAIESSNSWRDGGGEGSADGHKGAGPRVQPSTTWGNASDVASPMGVDTRMELRATLSSGSGGSNSGSGLGTAALQQLRAAASGPSLAPPPGIFRYRAGNTPPGGSGGAGGGVNDGSGQLTMTMDTDALEPPPGMAGMRAAPLVSPSGRPAAGSGALQGQQAIPGGWDGASSGQGWQQGAVGKSRLQGSSSLRSSGSSGILDARLSDLWPAGGGEGGAAGNAVGPRKAPMRQGSPALTVQGGGGLGPAVDVTGLAPAALMGQTAGPSSTPWNRTGSGDSVTMGLIEGLPSHLLSSARFAQLQQAVQQQQQQPQQAPLQQQYTALQQQQIAEQFLRHQQQKQQQRATGGLPPSSSYGSGMASLGSTRSAGDSMSDKVPVSAPSSARPMHPSQMMAAQDVLADSGTPSSQTAALHAGLPDSVLAALYAAAASPGESLDLRGIAPRVVGNQAQSLTPAEVQMLHQAGVLPQSLGSWPGPGVSGPMWGSGVARGAGGANAGPGSSAVAMSLPMVPPTSSGPNMHDRMTMERALLGGGQNWPGPKANPTAATPPSMQSMHAQMLGALAGASQQDLLQALQALQLQQQQQSMQPQQVQSLAPSGQPWGTAPEQALGPGMATTPVGSSGGASGGAGPGTSEYDVSVSQLWALVHGVTAPLHLSPAFSIDQLLQHAQALVDCSVSMLHEARRKCGLAALTGLAQVLRTLADLVQLVHSCTAAVVRCIQSGVNGATSQQGHTVVGEMLVAVMQLVCKLDQKMDHEAVVMVIREPLLLKEAVNYCFSHPAQMQEALQYWQGSSGRVLAVVN